MKVHLTKWGNSYAIRIPKIFMRHMGVESGGEIDMQMKDDRLVLSRPREDLKELVEHIMTDNRHEPTDWGVPVGKELW